MLVDINRDGLDLAVLDYSCVSVSNGRSVETIWARDIRRCISGHWALNLYIGDLHERQSVSEQ